jgi:hypothetical protein
VIDVLIEAFEVVDGLVLAAEQVCASGVAGVSDVVGFPGIPKIFKRFSTMKR